MVDGRVPFGPGVEKTATKANITMKRSTASECRRIALLKIILAMFRTKSDSGVSLPICSSRETLMTVYTKKTSKNAENKHM